MSKRRLMQVVRFGVQLLAGETLYHLANNLFALQEKQGKKGRCIFYPESYI